MKFELLCLTMPSRKEFLNRLIENLSPQLRGRTNVDMRIRMCDERYTLGENRDILLRLARSEYVAWVDDDDFVDPAYIETILPLLDGVDYVGFDLQCYIDGTALPHLTHHSLQFGNWYEDETGYYRDISHVNPIRRELALLEPFEGGHGEDKRWADRMRARGVLKTEHVISRVMYRYFFRSDKNRAEPCPECQSQSTVKVEIGSFCNCCGAEFNKGLVRKSCLWV